MNAGSGSGILRLAPENSAALWRGVARKCGAGVPARAFQWTTGEDARFTIPVNDENIAEKSLKKQFVSIHIL
jgi:hypothetical protein